MNTCVLQVHYYVTFINYIHSNINLVSEQYTCIKMDTARYTAKYTCTFFQKKRERKKNSSDLLKCTFLFSESHFTTCHLISKCTLSDSGHSLGYQSSHFCFQTVTPQLVTKCTLNGSTQLLGIAVLN